MKNRWHQIGNDEFLSVNGTWSVAIGRGRKNNGEEHISIQLHRKGTCEVYFLKFDGNSIEEDPYLKKIPKYVLVKGREEAEKRYTAWMKGE